MAIKRRTPEVNEAVAHRLKQIDADGCPRGHEAQAEAQSLVAAGWVSDREWVLTDAGQAVMNGYYQQRAADKAKREARTYVQPSAREVYETERKTLRRALGDR